MEEPGFRAGDLTIRFLDDHAHLLDGADQEGDFASAAVVAALLEDGRRRRLRVSRTASNEDVGLSAWRRGVRPWRKR